MNALRGRTGPKRVAVVQSAYIPWRGYFDIIASVDLYVVYDDVQYSRGTFQNRNRIKTADGLKWLTVPVSSSLGMAIDEVPIAWNARKNWLVQHQGLLEAALAGAPYATDALQLWKSCVSPADMFLSPLNVRLLKAICEYLGIRTPFAHSRDYATSGKKTERLLRLLQQVGTTHYLSGPSARDYLEHDRFRQAGIGLEYKTYDYAPYPQLWGPFEGYASILDLIANTGPAARDHLRSRTPGEIAVTCD